MRRCRMLSSLALILLLLTALSPTAAQDEISWLLSQINCLRQSVGSPPLTMNVALSVAANRQAVNLASDNLTDFHKGLDGSTPITRAKEAGYTGSVGENVAGGRQVSDAFNWWLNSSVHYENMTNPHWKDIGIGTASGPKGTWYTLVFGATNWEVNDFSPVTCSEFEALPPANIVIETSSIATQADTDDEVPETEPEASAEPLPTPVIMGLDEHGYIQHEIQSGETPGTIMLSYGYSWDALPTLMAINDMTEAEARNLDVGDIFLVPPLDGVVTPTPDDAVTETTPVPDEAEEEGLIILVASDTPPVSEEVASPTATVSERILPSPTPPPTLAATQTPTDSRPSLSGAFIATETLLPPVAFMPSATVTLRPTETLAPPVTVTSFATLSPVSSVTAVALAASLTVPPLTTPVEVAPPIPSSETSNQSPLLAVAAIVGQVAVIGAALMVGYRWGRRRT